MSKLPSIIDTADSLLLPDGGIIALKSPKFVVWLEMNRSFRFDCGLAGKDGYTARKENSGYWYAYKKIQGKLHKRYIGPGNEITISRLLEVAHKLVSEPKLHNKKLPNKLPNKVTEVTQVTLVEMQRAIESLTRRVEELEAATPHKVEVDLPTNGLEKRIEELEAQNSQLKEQNEYLQTRLYFEHSNVAFEVIEASSKNAELQAQNAELQAQIEQQPQPQEEPKSPPLDAEEFLKTLKLGKQSPDYKMAKKWITKFIEFQKALST